MPENPQKFTGEKDRKSSREKCDNSAANMYKFRRHIFRDKSGRAQKVPKLRTPHCKDAKTQY
jgi:hypothetical protein